ncbi:branched-chain amino acid ABC transporter permease [Salipiger pacificus]|nr:branched-chain amino acid ABC transporter permease [Alloyangia pacifica]
MIAGLLTATVQFGALFAVMTVALNLQYARAGMINFGTVAYFAAGAYAYAIFTQDPPSGLDQYALGLGLSPFAGFIAAGIAAIVFALLTGWPTLRLRGEYLALTTFAFAEVLHSLLLNERSIGNGSVGLTNVERPADLMQGLGDNAQYALMATLLLIATVLLSRRLLTSPYGRLVDAVRDDEVAAEAVGRDVRRVRLEVFVLSALPIGFAGALYAMITTLVSPAMFTSEVTFFVWIALALGGERTVLGAIMGTIALVFFQEVVRIVPFETVRGAQLAASLEEVVTGILFILVLRLRPWDRLKRRTAA